MSAKNQNKKKGIKAKFQWESKAVASNGQIMLFRCVMQMVLVSSNDMLWVVFSGASFHVIPHRSFLTSYASRGIPA